MNPIRQKHYEAMHYAELAFVEQQKLEPDREFIRLATERAFTLESDAANMAVNAPEPTRCVLHKSAACLAIDLGKYAEALSLIETGLAGQVPQPIKQELEELLEQVKEKLA